MRRENILIEELTKEGIEKLPKEDLSDLRSRFLNIYNRYFEGSDIEKAVGMERKVFLNKYLILRSEMARRGIRLFRQSPIDKEIVNRMFKKAIWSLDVPALGELMAVPDYVTVSGDFIKSPKSSDKIEVVIKSKEENRSEGFERKIGEMIKKQTGKEPYFTYTPEGPDSSYIPIFDLILKSQDETRKIRLEKKVVPIEKPEETENMIRIPVGDDCEVTATIKIDESQGISALYCGKVKQIRTYLFDKRVKAWTMASARAWIKEQKEKGIEKKLTAAQEAEYKAESEKIRENSKSAKYPHKFKQAKWTHPNGHPRCLICGQEERIDGKDKPVPCTKSVTKFEITKINKKQQIIGGIVYEPHEVDTQGDYTDEKEIEKAIYLFMEKYATDTKRAKINHEGKRYFFPILESFQADEDTMKGGKVLKKGSWWLMMKVTNKNIWEKIESGELSGFSMGGVAREG